MTGYMFAISNFSHAKGYSDSATVCFSHANVFFSCAMASFTCAMASFTCAMACFTCAMASISCAMACFSCAELYIGVAENNFIMIKYAFLKYDLSPNPSFKARGTGQDS